ncbi:hypothetical protein LCGC14_1381710 [marine sediment metagenome]|uniref:Uncharacterized protein n=1 Tax=marine sediment metagenome TaxID=412755 RepID=A0A0F9KNE2_9ZZZZ
MILFCEECDKETKHDRCRDHSIWYNRCSGCLKRQIEETGCFVPPHTRAGRGRKNKYVIDFFSKWRDNVNSVNDELTREFFFDVRSFEQYLRGEE